MTLVSRNIRYLRRLHGMTQEEFAQKIGIKRSLLGAYEEERASPNLTNLVNMAKAFDLTVDELITLDIRKVREAASVLEGEGSNVNFYKEIEMDYEEEESPLEEEIEEEFVAEIPKAKIPEKKEISEEKASTKAESKAEKESKPEEASRYARLDDTLFSAPQPQAAIATPQAGQDIALVKQNLQLSYLAHYEDEKFIHSLPQLQFSLLDKNESYRAFEMGADFPMPRAIVVGQYVPNWYRLPQESQVVLVSQKQGVLYGKLSNHLEKEGYFLLESQHPHFPLCKVGLREVFEIWLPVLFFSTQMPAIQSGQQHLEHLVAALQIEISKLKKSSN